MSLVTAFLSLPSPAQSASSHLYLADLSNQFSCFKDLFGQAYHSTDEQHQVIGSMTKFSQFYHHFDFPS